MTNQYQVVETTVTPAEKWRIWRNIIIIGFAFMVHFTAFWGAANLQSSINAGAALGTFTLASIHGSLLLSNILLPTMFIKWFGCKWTMVIAILSYVPFITSQFYPSFFTMIPAGLLVGLGGGPLWCAKCTFLSVASETYSKVTGTPADIALTRFFGVFFTFYQLSQLWGNIISSAVLSSGNTNTFQAQHNTSVLSNVTFLDEILITSTTHYSEDVRVICGAKFCPGTRSLANPNLHPPAVEKIQLIAGIYLTCMIAASLCIAIGVDSLKRYEQNHTRSAQAVSGFRLLAVTLKHARLLDQILIIPITMFIGVEHAFLEAEYTASFISCSWGISNIGYVMMCFGVANALSSLLIGGLVKKIGRNPMVAFGLTLHLAILITILIWKPHPENKLPFFVIAGLWGLCDSVWIVQVNALNGILFPGKQEAAYSNLKLWQATGALIAYIYSPYLCTNVKIYVLMGLLLIGVLGYATIEVKEHTSIKSKLDSKRGEFQLINNNHGDAKGEFELVEDNNDESISDGHTL